MINYIDKYINIIYVVLGLVLVSSVLGYIYLLKRDIAQLKENELNLNKKIEKLISDNAVELANNTTLRAVLLEQQLECNQFKADTQEYTQNFDVQENKTKADTKVKKVLADRNITGGSDHEILFKSLGGLNLNSL